MPVPGGVVVLFVLCLLWFIASVLNWMSFRAGRSSLHFYSIVGLFLAPVGMVAFFPGCSS